MDKQQLEIRLGDALARGFIPSRVTVPKGAGQLVVIGKEGEDDRITIAFRSADRDQSGSIARLHTDQFIYTLEEVVKLLEEYNK